MNIMDPMPDKAIVGATFSHYQILEKLGQGGMGQVFRARDTKLERTVAIKILPPEKTGGNERHTRFMQEARAASALNHPNIITVHDISSENDVLYIVMEYIEGKTLEAAIPRKGMQLNEALRIAVQMAEGLAKAHGAGIVHRDLKPGNVMITSDGLVKVLDFGLAKLTETAATSEDAATRTLQSESEPGTIIGTAGYMSPEQAQGLRVDARSDIFSFGTVLYEMVTGHRAFQGESKMSTLAAIINQEPEPLPAGTPHDLERIIGRCLRKDPARRFQHMVDVKVALEELKEESESGRLTAPVAAVKPQSKWARWAAAGAAVVILGGGLAAWKLWRPAASGLRPIKRLTHDETSFMGALSPDGKLLAYCRRLPDKPDSDIWLQQVDGGQPVRLTDDPAEDQSPSFSPDGTSIVFRSSRRGGGIFVMSALGGEARQVAPDGEFPVFSPDGSEIAYVSGSSGLLETRRIQIVRASGGTPAVFQPDYMCMGWPVWSPDGSQILFSGYDGTRSGIFVAPRKGGAARWIDPGPDATGKPITAWRWVGGKDRMAPEWLAVTLGGLEAAELYRLPVSKTGGISGKLSLLASATHGVGFPSIAADGRMVFTAFDVLSNLWDLPLGANSGRLTGPARQITSGHDDVSIHSISRDGSRLAFVSGHPNGSDPMLRDLRTGAERVLSSGGGARGLSISPDGSQVVLWVPKSEGSELHVVPTDGGPSRLVTAQGGYPNGWLPDGSGVLCQGGRISSIFLIDIATGKRTPLLQHPTDQLHSAFFSADGAWITFHQRLRPGHVRLMAAPYRNGQAGGPDQWVAMTDGTYDDDKPRLSPDGARLYFQSNRDGFICVWSQRLDAKTKRSLGQPEAVQHYHGSLRSIVTMYGGANRLHLSLAADRMIVNLEELRSDLWMVDAER
jgi:Tol biopolymer transport system component